MCISIETYCSIHVECRYGRIAPLSISATSRLAKWHWPCCKMAMFGGLESLQLGATEVFFALLWETQLGSFSMEVDS